MELEREKDVSIFESNSNECVNCNQKEMKFFIWWMKEKKRDCVEEKKRQQQIHQCQIYTYSFFFNFYSFSRFFLYALLSQNSSVRNQSSFSSLVFTKTKPPKPIWSSSRHISSFNGDNDDDDDDDKHIVVKKKDVIRCNTVLTRANTHTNKYKKKRRKRR